MYKINENYLKLQGSYLFSTIGKKVAGTTLFENRKSFFKKARFLIN